MIKITKKRSLINLNRDKKNVQASLTFRKEVCQDFAPQHLSKLRFENNENKKMFKQA